MESLTETARFSARDIFRDEVERVPRLVVVDGPQLGKMFELSDETTLIGRAPSCAVPLDSFGVSRHHATIDRRGDELILRDLGSTNGTLVDGVSIQEHTLRDGDIFVVGSATLKFLEADNLEQSCYRYLYEESTRDPVTQIPNRRYFNEVLLRETARVHRYGRPLSLLLLDIDHFKRVNDTYGHLCGDAVLHDLAQVVTPLLRSSEFVARYGGEEFVVVLPETPLDGARVAAERIRADVSAHPFPWEEQTLHVTVSIGVAAWSDEMREPADLVAAADRRLYEAKSSGRDRVCAEDSGARHTPTT